MLHLLHHGCCYSQQHVCRSITCSCYAASLTIKEFVCSTELFREREKCPLSKQTKNPPSTAADAAEGAILMQISIDFHSARQSEIQSMDRQDKENM